MGSVRSKPSPLPNRGDEQRPERHEYGDDMDLGYFLSAAMCRSESPMLCSSGFRWISANGSSCAARTTFRPFEPNLSP